MGAERHSRSAAVGNARIPSRSLAILKATDLPRTFTRENWFCKSRLPQEPRGYGGDDGRSWSERGHELTPEPADAEVLVVNTCSFIDPAKQESIDTILEMAEYKKIRPGAQA